MKLTRHSVDSKGNQLYTDSSNRVCDGTGKLVKAEKTKSKIHTKTSQAEIDSWKLTSGFSKDADFKAKNNAKETRKTA